MFYLLVLGLIGMPGAGKGECARIARDEQIKVVNMGELVREYAVQIGLVLTDENIGTVAHSEREKFGYGIWAKRTLENIKGLNLQGDDIIIIDGVRGDAEITVFHEEFGEDFYTLAVKMPVEKRFELLQKRKRLDAPISRKQFDVREEREAQWGIESALEKADYVLMNTGTLAELETSFKELLAIIKKQAK